MSSGVLLVFSLLAGAAIAQQGGGVSRALQQPPPQAAAPAQEAKPEDYCTIEGMVVDANTGAPLNKAQLMLMKMESRGQQPGGATTDAGGRFTFKNIEPGRYMLSAERNRYARQTYGQRAPRGPGTPLTLVARQQLKDVVFKLVPSAVVTGRVVDEDGEPVAHAEVNAMQFRYFRGKRQMMPSGGASTNDLGEYRMFGVSPGRYYISATLRDRGQMMARVSRSSSSSDQAPESAYATVYYPGVLDPSQAAPMELRGGEEKVGIDFRLSKVRAVTISGRVIHPVKDGAGGQAGQVFVNLSAKGAPGFGPMERRFVPVSGGSGRFEMAAVLPGSYVLNAFARPGSGDQLFASMPLEIGNSDVEGLELVLSAGATLSGNVRIESETPTDIRLSDLRVFLRPKDQQGGPFMMGSPGSGTVSSEGSFELRNVAPQEYVVSVSPLQDDCYLKAVRLGDQDVLQTGLQFVQGVSGGALELVISPLGGRIEGAVLDDKKQPFAGGMAVLVPEGAKRSREDSFKQVTTDQNGRFTFRGVPPGDYKVFAWDSIDYGAYMDPAFLEVYEDRGKKVTLKEREQQALDIDLIRLEESAQ